MKAWGRQTAIATVPLGAIQEMTVLSNAFSSEFGWTSGPALNIVTKSGTNELSRRSALPDPSRRLAGEDVLDQGLLPAVRADLRHAQHARRRSTRWTFRMSSARSPARSAGRSSRTRRSSSPRLTTRGRIARRSSRPRCRPSVAGGRQPRLHGSSPDALRRPAGPQAHAEPELDVAFQRRSVLRRQPAGRRRRHERAQRRAPLCSPRMTRRARWCGPSGTRWRSRLTVPRRRPGYIRFHGRARPHRHSAPHPRGGQYRLARAARHGGHRRPGRSPRPNRAEPPNSDSPYFRVGACGEAFRPADRCGRARAWRVTC